MQVCYVAMFPGFA